ncbi:response regulator [Rubrivirga sp. IMCC43871]|uniref:response regulator n=1 Tax=Rubrivirga sp. IMCC43871 TaxID=3391575 RepID=UPI00398FBCB3
MPALPAVRTILIDDHPALRAGVRAELERSGRIEVVAEASDGEHGIEACLRLEPNVVLLDMEMPGMDGVAVAERLRELDLPTRILAYSAYDDAAYVTAMLQAGAAGYVTKDKPMSLVVEAVEAVARGEGRWFVSINAPDGLDVPISDRELEVVRLMARGKDNYEIAETLGISPNTVRNHVSSAYDKLGVSSWRQAVAWAWEHGLV